MSSDDRTQTTRRRFLQFLAASPIAACPEFELLAEEAAACRTVRMILGGNSVCTTINSPADAINVFDFELIAARTVPPAHFAYMTSGVDDEITLRVNRTAFQNFVLRPRRLVDVSHVDMSADILGTKYRTPIVIAPAGGHKAYHPDGEIGVARAAREGDHLQILSTQANTSIADVIEARGQSVWYQLYATNSFDVAKHHVRSAEQQGAAVVAVTVDGNGTRKLETYERLRALDKRDCQSCHNRTNLNTRFVRRPMYKDVDMTDISGITGTALTWDKIRRIRDLTNMKMVLKGIMASEDAELAARYGFDGIIVSNHGGRVGDHGRSTIDALPEIVDAAGSIPVLVDSGFRRGTDIIKALCMGARGIAIGRPYLWGLGAFGQAGVEKVLELLRQELQVAMQQIGAPSIRDLVPSMVMRIRPPWEE